MTIDATLQLYELAVSSADALGEVGTFHSEADLQAHEEKADAAMAEVERLLGVLSRTHATSLPPIVAKLRIATDLARQDEADDMPEWKLVKSALRDLAKIVTVSVTQNVLEPTS